MQRPSRNFFVSRQPAASRQAKGGVLPEFTSALTIFVLCLLIPLANLSAVPIRYVIAYGMVSDLAHRLSLEEKRSKALELADAPSFYQELGLRTGVTVTDCKVSVIVQNTKNETAIFEGRKPISPEWLPGGSRGQCDYLIQTDIAVSITPLICLGPKIPALTAPVQMTITCRSAWENLGIDPLTQTYYINE